MIDKIILVLLITSSYPVGILVSFFACTLTMSLFTVWFETLDLNYKLLYFFSSLVFSSIAWILTIALFELPWVYFYGN